MGLLDDAIREHMELKRLRGADPSEVARQERDALGPVVRERDGDEQELRDGEDGHGGEHGEHDHHDSHDEAAPSTGAPGADDPAAAPDPGKGSDFANIGQETAELDMRTVLDEQHEAADRAGQIDSAGLGAAAGEDGEPVEDVLEETPEFLRDTPEQERLWFEQQPPRDFDFDK
jgi:hypothetical protein